MITALLLYLQVAVSLLVGLGAWRLVRRLVLDRPPVVPAVATSRLAHLFLLASLTAPLAVGLLPAIEPSARGARPEAAVLAPPDAAALGGGFSLLGATPPGLEPWHVMALGTLVAMLTVPSVVVAIGRTASQAAWLTGVLRRSRPVREVGRVRVSVSDEIATPFSTVLLGRADVVLPTSLSSDPAALRVAIRHELQHHRRRDTAWAVALEVTAVAFAWNPVVRGWCRELTLLQEHACDEEVLGRGVSLEDYADCLLRVAEAVPKGHRLIASTTMASPGGGLRQRIERMLNTERRASRLDHPRRIAVAVAAAFVVSAAWITAAASPRADELPTSAAWAGPAPSTAAHGGNPAVGIPAPDVALGVGARAPDVMFRTSDGRDLSLSELRGKHVLIEFWASWCRFCEASIPSLRALEARHASDDLAIVLISVNTDRPAFERFIEKHDLRWPQHHADEGWQSAASRAYGVKALPFLVAVDPGGLVLAEGVQPEAVAAAIDRSIAGHSLR